MDFFYKKDFKECYHENTNMALHLSCCDKNKLNIIFTPYYLNYIQNIIIILSYFTACCLLLDTRSRWYNKWTVITWRGISPCHSRTLPLRPLQPSLFSFFLCRRLAGTHFCSFPCSVVPVIQNKLIITGGIPLKIFYKMDFFHFCFMIFASSTPVHRCLFAHPCGLLFNIHQVTNIK